MMENKACGKPSPVSLTREMRVFPSRASKH
jgi:hypothetical protein